MGAVEKKHGAGRNEATIAEGAEAETGIWWKWW